MAAALPFPLPLITQLSKFVRLSDDDRSALAKLTDAPMVTSTPRTDIISEGESPNVVRLVVDGWAYSYKDLPDGRRQTVGYFIPGDFCDLNVYILKQMDHSIGAITRVRHLAIPPEQIEHLTNDYPRIAQALLWHELVSSGIQREWLLNLGQRNALERIAHLLVELWLRLRAVGLTHDFSCHFPLTQTDLAEAAGITPVHVNRTLQDLRRDGLIELSGRQLRILDFDRLRRLAMFNANYLHLDHEGHYLDANS